MFIHSFMHMRNSSSELAPRLSAPTQQDRGRRGERKAGGRTEGCREEVRDREPENRGTREQDKSVKKEGVLTHDL